MTAILLSLSSLALVVRVRAIHEAKPTVSAGQSTLTLFSSSSSPFYLYLSFYFCEGDGSV